jgi:glycosyltransferase involved in cell wall biosynthesis
MARRIARARGVPWLYDVRGLLAQEYVDAGHWRANGWRASRVERLERRLLADADAIVTLTRAVETRLPPSPAPKAVIPCSVDTSEFRPSDSERAAVRSELGLGAAPVLVYSGSLGSWYRLDEMLDFYVAARRRLPQLCFLVLSPQCAVAQAAAAARGLADRVVAIAVPPDAVPRHLAAADFGVCFLGRLESKVASSPTKYGEYLASGLPVVTNDWIGDARLLAHEPAWLTVCENSPAEYERAAEMIDRLLAQAHLTRQAARGLAMREFSLQAAVDRYDELYRRVVS